MMSELHPIYKEIGQRIKVRRKALKVNQDALAYVVGFARPTSISEIEKGKIRVQIDDLLVIAHALGCSMYMLLPEYTRNFEVPT
jgi:transcriptional regulator with XRE-family HTH domain